MNYIREGFFFTFQEIVKTFSTVQDPDYAGHVILEQFQAQVACMNWIVFDLM